MNSASWSESFYSRCCVPDFIELAACSHQLSLMMITVNWLSNEVPLPPYHKMLFHIWAILFHTIGWSFIVCPPPVSMKFTCSFRVARCLPKNHDFYQLGQLTLRRQKSPRAEPLTEKLCSSQPLPLWNSFSPPPLRVGTLLGDTSILEYCQQHVPDLLCLISQVSV